MKRQTFAQVIIAAGIILTGCSNSHSSNSVQSSDPIRSSRCPHGDLDSQVQACLTMKTLVAGDLSWRSLPIARELLGLSCASRLGFAYSDEVVAVVKVRIREMIQHKGDKLTPREEALAVLKLPDSTSDDILKKRLELIDQTVADVRSGDPRWFHCDAPTLFQWYPHIY